MNRADPSGLGWLTNFIRKLLEGGDGAVEATTEPITVTGTYLPETAETAGPTSRGPATSLDFSGGREGEGSPGDSGNGGERGGATENPTAPSPVPPNPSPTPSPDPRQQAMNHFTGMMFGGSGLIIGGVLLGGPVTPLGAALIYSGGIIGGTGFIFAAYIYTHPDAEYPLKPFGD